MKVEITESYGVYTVTANCCELVKVHNLDKAANIRDAFIVEFKAVKAKENFRLGGRRFSFTGEIEVVAVCQNIDNALDFSVLSTEILAVAEDILGKVYINWKPVYQSQFSENPYAFERLDRTIRGEYGIALDSEKVRGGQKFDRAIHITNL